MSDPVIKPSAFRIKQLRKAVKNHGKVKWYKHRNTFRFDKLQRLSLLQ